MTDKLVERNKLEFVQRAFRRGAQMGLGLEWDVRLAIEHNSTLTAKFDRAFEKLRNVGVFNAPVTFSRTKLLASSLPTTFATSSQAESSQEFGQVVDEISMVMEILLIYKKRIFSDCTKDDLTAIGFKPSSGVKPVGTPITPDMVVREEDESAKTILLRPEVGSSLPAQGAVPLLRR